MDHRTSEDKIDSAPLTEAHTSLPNVDARPKSIESEPDTNKEESSPANTVSLQTNSEKTQEIEQKETNNENSKKKYRNIPNDIRLKLIDAIENKGEKIKHVRLP